MHAMNFPRMDTIVKVSRRRERINKLKTFCCIEHSFQSCGHGDLLTSFVSFICILLFPFYCVCSRDASHSEVSFYFYLSWHFFLLLSEFQLSMDMKQSSKWNIIGAMDFFSWKSIQLWEICKMSVKFFSRIDLFFIRSDQRDPLKKI